MQRTTCSMQHTTRNYNMPHATCRLQHATCNMQHARGMQIATCNMEHATCNVQHAPCERTVRSARCSLTQRAVLARPTRTPAVSTCERSCPRWTESCARRRQARRGPNRPAAAAPAAPAACRPPRNARMQAQHACSRAVSPPLISRMGGVPPCLRVHSGAWDAPWAAAPRRLRAA